MSYFFFKRDRPIYEQTNRGFILSNVFRGEPPVKYCEVTNIQAI